MNSRLMPSRRETAILDTEELRNTFLLNDLFANGEIRLVSTDLDRAIVGSAIPCGTPLELPNDDALKADFFCQRREIGVLNIGGPGTVTVDGTNHEMGTHDCLYIGRGEREVTHSGERRLAPEGVAVRNPAFDVTPARLISAIITEHGLARGDYRTRLAELVAKSR